MCFKLFFQFLVLLIICDYAFTQPAPIVMWHGMGDSCCMPFSMGAVKHLLQSQLEHVHVLSLEIGSNVVYDTLNGFFMPINEQVERACSIISSDAALSKGYNALGFSQGGAFLRAVAQRCPSPPMLNLVTFGGPHQGVFGLPHCLSPVGVCELVRKMLDIGAYNQFVQSHLVQAQYWHDPTKQLEYSRVSQFLADINNEPPRQNSSYADNLNRLSALVLVKFSRDSMVVPRESAHFGFYAGSQDRRVVDVRETPLYIQDYIGLRRLDEQGKLKFLSVDGDHLQFTDQWLIDNIINVYLR